MALSTRPVTFAGEGGQTLTGRVHTPAGTPRAWALFAHCFTCSKDLRAAVRIAEALAEQGIAVLRFDFTGLGESDGEFSDTTFSSNIGDLLAAAAFLREAHQAPQILVGHSLGGAAVLAAAAKVPEVAAVVTIGAPADPGHVEHLLEPARAEIEARGEAEVTLAGRTFRIKQQFLDDLRAHALTERVATLGRALLICHAPRDTIVGIDNARTLYEAARHPKSFLSLDDADHLLSRPRDAAYVGAMIAAWSARYVEQPEGDAGDADAPAAPGGVVEVRGGQGLAQDVLAEGHRLRADEPGSVGGTGTGPSPYGLLLAALGTCTSMTLRLYADRKKWPLDGVVVTLRHHRIHAADCDDCETKVGKIDVIERRVAIEGALSDEQRARLLEIADKCPVHRTLTSEIRIRTEPG
jgi:uncharacterized OsmC-like protein/fermentation-respiration switch protein FrsA (DUF1100 family)